MTATVIPFPMAYRTGRIRHVAGILRRKAGRDAERYWSQQILVMRRQMLAAQIDEDVTKQALDEFEREVFAHLPCGIPKGAA